MEHDRGWSAVLLRLSGVWLCRATVLWHTYHVWMKSVSCYLSVILKQCFWCVSKLCQYTWDVFQCHAQIRACIWDNYEYHALQPWCPLLRPFTYYPGIIYSSHCNTLKNKYQYLWVKRVAVTWHELEGLSRSVVLAIAAKRHAPFPCRGEREVSQAVMVTRWHIQFALDISR